MRYSWQRARWDKAERAKWDKDDSDRWDRVDRVLDEIELTES